MELIIKKAKLVLSNMFSFDAVHFERHSSRQSHIMEGRRFLIYFLRKELEITYEGIILHIPALTNHVTAIHHYNKMNDLLELERTTIQKYDDFLELIENNTNNVIDKELTKYTDKRKQINNEIYKLKKLL